MIGIGYVLRTSYGYVQDFQTYNGTPLTVCTGKIEEAHVWSIENIAERVARRHGAVVVKVQTELIHGQVVATDKPLPSENQDDLFTRRFNIKY